jgi:hypothetical protein
MPQKKRLKTSALPHSVVKKRMINTRESTNNDETKGYIQTFLVEKTLHWMLQDAN